VLNFNLELVYGHAWGSGVVPGEFRLSPGDIGRRHS
jgi:hypothetical protein